MLSAEIIRELREDHAEADKNQVIVGGLSHLPPKFEHIFVAVITFPPFFCADTFITSLLLIVCALRYVKSLYRHFVLEDISKHARVTQKMALPNFPVL